MAFKINLVDELLELFEVKRNPVVEFWFAPMELVDNGTAKFPADFSLYKKYNEKKLWMDDRMWGCWIKQSQKGCFSKSYWKK